MNTQSVEKLVKCFIEGKETRLGNYFIEGGQIIYKALTERTLTFSNNETIRKGQITQLKHS